MADEQINRVLRAGPGRRNVELQNEPFGQPPAADSILIRNRLTLIYPGVDLARLAQSAAENRWIELGCIGLGQVEDSSNPDLSNGDWVLWNGPHADYAYLDPNAGLWVRVEDPNPLLLLSFIGAEASRGLLDALGPSHVPARSIVIGQGMLGHLAAQWLRWRGSSVTVVENSPKRLEFSKYLGLTQKIDTHNVDWRKRIERWNPNGVDLLVDATGYPTPVVEVLPFLRSGGVLCLVGAWRPDLNATTIPSEIAQQIAKNNITISGPHPVRASAPTKREHVNEWVRPIGDKTIPVDRLITDHVPASDGPISVKRLAAGVKSICGVVIHWTD